MDFTISLLDREVQRAESLQSRVRLYDIALYRSEMDGAGPPIQSVEPVRLDAELDSELGHLDSLGVDFAVTLRVTCEEPLAFHIHVTYLVRYRLAEGTTASKNEIDAFRKSHAVLAAWPYIREFVQNSAARMGFPTEALPLLRLVTRKAGSSKRKGRTAPQRP